MSDPSELKEFAAAAVAKDLEIWARRADQEQRKFLRGLYRTRVVGGLALIAVLISSTRLDQIALQFADKAVDSNRVGLVITACAVVLGALTVWSARAVGDRGYLRGWVRYSLTAQALRVHQHDIDLAWHRFCALSAPTDEDRKKVIDDIAKISAQAKQVTLEEAEQWAVDVSNDLSNYLKGTLKIAETAAEAKQRTKLSR